MTQPAKAQEPSMEEILASIRRIIADDDASKSTAHAPEPPRAEPPPPAAPAVQPIRTAPPPPVPRPAFEAEPRPAPAPPPAPPAPPPSASRQPSPFEADAIADALADEPADTLADESADILDLTESMEAPVPAAPSPPADFAPHVMPQAAPQFRTIDGSSDIDFDEASEKPAAPPPYYADVRSGLVSSATSAAVDSAFNALAQTVLVQNARTLEDLVREMLRPMLKSWLDDNLPGLVERLVRAEIERVSRGRTS